MGLVYALTLIRCVFSVKNKGYQRCRASLRASTVTSPYRFKFLTGVQYGQVIKRGTSCFTTSRLLHAPQDAGEDQSVGGYLFRPRG